jgi:hypothetical protein
LERRLDRLSPSRGGLTGGASAVAKERSSKAADGLLDALGGRPYRLYGAAMLRIFSGGTAAWFMISDYGRRSVLWGPRRVGLDLAGSSGARGQLPVFRLYDFAHGDTAFNLVFHIGLIVAIAFAVCGGRALAVAHAALFLSLCNCAPMALEGGENLERILVLLLPFMITDAHLSPLATRTRRQLQTRGSAGHRWYLTAVHNTAAALAVFQICVLYFVAGMWKIADDTWRSGTAIFYILHVDQNNFFAPLTQLMNNAMLTTMASYVTVALEVLFPWIALTRNGWLRKIGVGMVECMHVGIMIGMGLVVFGLIMIGADMAVLRDADYDMLTRAARQVRSRVRAHG